MASETANDDTPEAIPVSSEPELQASTAPGKRHHHSEAISLPDGPIPFWKNMPNEPTFVQSVCRTTLALTARFISGATPRWIQSQPDTCQRVYFGNHTSNLDGPIIWATLPPQIRAITRPVAASDYWKKSAVRRFVTQHVFNTILIDR